MAPCFALAPVRFPSPLPTPTRLPQRCQVGGRDQFGQYAARDAARLKQQKHIAASHAQREYHYHILLNQGSIKAFLPAAQRFLDALQNDPGWAASPQRLWLLRSVADPTFGSLRGEPFPPRFMLVHQPELALSGAQAAASPVQSWLSALDRAGHALSSFTSHSVTFAQWGRYLADVRFETLQPHHVLATEIVNADWTDANTVPSIRQTLLRHAARSTQRGHAQLFDVLQSVAEPTCFKTLEVYSSIDHLAQQMQLFDKQFDQEIAPSRAAVNRVRQLYSCIGAL